MSDSQRDDARVLIMKSGAPRAIEWAAERLANGGVIGLPTDTVYGIAASLSFPDAIERIFAIKGRPDANPLPVLVSSTSMVHRLASHPRPEVELLLDRFWPGPLTVVVPAKPGIPSAVLAGGTTVGLRMPNHPLAIEVINKAGGAVACTSANRSGEAPARNAEEVGQTIGALLDLILDGGVAPGGVPSTVIEVTNEDLVVHREGAIAAETVIGMWEELIAGADRTAM